MNFFMWELFCYAAVGLAGIVTDFTITAVCKEKWKWNKYVANSLGFGFAVIQNYLLNTYWTFKHLVQNSTYPFLFFVVIALTGLAINNLLIFWFSKKIKKKFYLVKAGAVFLVFFWNFTLNRILIFV